MIEEIKVQTKQVVSELFEEAKPKAGQILVVGCSSSEVANCQIGTHSSEEIGRAIFDSIMEKLEGTGIFLAAQCCEHLNRALILEERMAELYGYEIVNVVPKLKAGGSFATAAYLGMSHPVAVEHILAHVGIDIGDTLIGMHLRDVVVPVRTKTNKIGGAHVVCARTRAKYIGGERACYKN